jgi:GntR family transcriptional regulator
MSRIAAPALPGSYAPLYARLRQVLHDRVTAGEWRPGEKIPTIRELGETYGVSRITVVQALDELSREGLLVRWQGKGVFVSEPRPEAPCMPLQSFTEATLSRGHTPSSRTLRLTHEPSTPDVSDRLGPSLDEGVALLERLRLSDGCPIAIQHVYLPEHVVPGLVERTQPIESLYQLLSETYGIVPTNAFERYEPIQLDPDQARLLESQPGAPAFQVDRTTTDQYGRTIEFATSALSSDRYEIRLNLRR